MTQAPSEVSYGVGACGTCRHLFLLTPELRTCPLCDRPADREIAFSEEAAVAVAVAEEAEASASAPEPPIPFTVTCPHCDQAVLLEVTQEAIMVVTPPAVPPEEEVGEPPSRTEPPPPPPIVGVDPQEPMVPPQDGPPAPD